MSASRFPWMDFPALREHGPRFAHAFTLRHPEIDVRVERDEAIRRLTAGHREVLRGVLGFPADRWATAEQVHGNGVAVIHDLQEVPAAGADGLVSGTPGLALGIHVADCCAVFLVDPVSGAFGLVHSGRKGTEQNITGAAIRALRDHFGARPEDLVVQLSPCIRPPAYEVDFAAAIRRQAREAGVAPDRVHDAGCCTASDPERFYSYRREKGRTGRMLALLGRR